MGLQEKLAKRAERFLAPGERTVASCNCQRVGALAGGALGGVVGAAIATQTGKASASEAVAGGFPVAAQMIVTATDRRLIMFFGNKLIGTVDRDQLAGAEILKKPVFWPWTISISLRNGHVARLTCNRGADGFVAAVQDLADGNRTGAAADAST